MNYFVTAIGTNSGKTTVSAVLCEALTADYWKPVQAGLPRDSETILRRVSNQFTKIHPELFLLSQPASPHAAAEFDNIEITLSDFSAPASDRDLIIEGAGGALVPLNQREFVIDMAEKFTAEIILVSDLYLGSINHSLLTVEAIKRRNLKVKGIIFNGYGQQKFERESINIILRHSEFELLLIMNRVNEITNNQIRKWSDELLKKL